MGYTAMQLQHAYSPRRANTTVAALMFSLAVVAGTFPAHADPVSFRNVRIKKL